MNNHEALLLQIKTNLKAISIILEKFALFDIVEDEMSTFSGIPPFTSELPATSDKDRLPGTISESPGEVKKESFGKQDDTTSMNRGDLLRSRIDFILNSHLHPEDTTEDLPLDFFQASSANRSNSLLIDVLEFNYPGFILLYLQQQSDRLLQLRSEVCLFCETYQREVSKFLDSSYVSLNRTINALEPHNGHYDVETTLTMARVNQIYDFCKRLDPFPDKHVLQHLISFELCYTRLHINWNS